jgi:uncharacterized protein YndB with AHSA1/START domain
MLPEQPMVLEQAPVAKAAMLVRRPVAEVFEALVNPEVTAHFWFTSGSGRLAPGARVQWHWEMYGVSAEVIVREFDECRHLRLDWGGDGAYTALDWRFTPLGEDATFVAVEHSGFTGAADALVAEAIGATEGFTLVLAGLKAWLEHGLELRLVQDRFPAGLE